MVQHQSGMLLRQKIEALVTEKLAIELRTVCRVTEHLARRKPSNTQINLPQFKFSRAWGITQADWQFVSSEQTHDEPAGEQSSKQLHTAFYALHNAIAYLKTQVPAYLQDSLTSQQHAPATGLFMVFLRLYGKAQQKINQFTQRHLDFLLSSGARSQAKRAAARACLSAVYHHAG